MRPSPPESRAIPTFGLRAHIPDPLVDLTRMLWRVGPWHARPRFVGALSLGGLLPGQAVGSVARDLLLGTESSPALPGEGDVRAACALLDTAGLARLEHP